MWKEEQWLEREAVCQEWEHLRVVGVVLLSKNERITLKIEKQIIPELLPQKPKLSSLFSNSYYNISMYSFATYAFQT